MFEKCSSTISGIVVLLRRLMAEYMKISLFRDLKPQRYEKDQLPHLSSPRIAAMLNYHLIHVLALGFLFTTVVSGFAFNSSTCSDPPGFDSCWNQATSDAISLFKHHCNSTSGSCADVDECFSPDETCAKITVCTAYTEWINCALNHCWNRVSMPIFRPENV